MRNFFDYAVAWAATRLGYVPASRLTQYQAKTQRAARLVDAYRKDALGSEQKASRFERAAAQLRKVEQSFRDYRDAQVSAAAGRPVRVLERTEERDPASGGVYRSITLALPEPAFPL